MVVNDWVEIDVSRSTLGEQFGDLLRIGQVVQLEANAGHIATFLDLQHNNRIC